MFADMRIDTLLHPFRSGLVALPRSSCRVLCIGLSEQIPVHELSGADITYAQDFRPYYLALDRAGCRVGPAVPTGVPFDAVLIRLGRHRQQNENWLASALRIVRHGGLIAAAGGKTDGAASLRKRIAGFEIVLNHASLDHGVVFWFEADKGRKGVAARLETAVETLVDGRYTTSPGMFSHGKIDAGSRLLADRLPNFLSGEVADFCAGWGYLSARILDRENRIEKLHLYEADHASIEAARHNLSGVTKCEFAFYWRDLRSEPIPHKYDAIVMNPPFHRGRKAEPDIGAGLIETAARALKNRGDLFLVANRRLPYENAIKASFSRSELLADEGGYKVIRSTKQAETPLCSASRQ